MGSQERSGSLLPRPPPAGARAGLRHHQPYGAGFLSFALQQELLRGAAGGAAEVVYQQALVFALVHLLDITAVGPRERLLHAAGQVGVGVVGVLVDREDTFSVDGNGQLSLAEG